MGWACTHPVACSRASGAWSHVGVHRSICACSGPCCHVLVLGLPQLAGACCMCKYRRLTGSVVRPILLTEWQLQHGCLVKYPPIG